MIDLILGASTEISQKRWVPLYTFVVSAVGGAILLLALTNLPADLLGLLLFAITAAAAELLSVELFVTSRRSTISVSGIIALGGVVTFGPLAGALIHLAVATVSVVRSSAAGERSGGARADWWQRFTFNVGMWIIASAAAGMLYGALGGQFGQMGWLRNFIPLVAAATVDVGLNLVLLIGVISLQSGRNPWEIWRQDFLWSVPITILGSVLGGGVLAAAYQIVGFAGVLVVFLPVIATGYAFRLYTANLRTYVSELEGLNQELDAVNLSLLETLGAVIDADDMYTYGHSKQVTIYAEAIGQEMEIPAEDLARIVRGGLLHDVGKIGIKDSIISKPGRLTDEEYEILKRHTTIGAEIVGRMKGLQDLVPLVRSHHERWDGRGYPDGLVGEETPFLARILCVADSVEAMLSDRPYRPTRHLADAVAEVERCSGSQFDPEIATAFLAVAAKRPEIFKNSAGDIQEVLKLQGADSSFSGKHYAKKSMVNAM